MGNKKHTKFNYMMIIIFGIIINGDEIGMEDMKVSYEETVDLSACKAGPNKYEKLTRDLEKQRYNKCWLFIQCNCMASCA